MGKEEGRYDIDRDRQEIRERKVRDWHDTRQRISELVDLHLQPHVNSLPSYFEGHNRLLEETLGIFSDPS